MTHSQAETSKPRHLAFIVNNYPPKTGGVELHVSSLARVLAEEGVQVTVFTLDRAEGETVEGDIRVVRLSCTPMIGNVLAFPWPGTRQRILRRLRDLQVDAVSVHTRFFPMTYLGVRIARKLGVPAILTEHGSDHVRGVSWAVGAASRLVDHTLGKYVLKNAVRVLAISEASQSFIAKLTNVHAEVFRNAIDVAKFTNETPEPAARRKIVFLGRLVPGKGWDLVLEVAKELHREGLDFQVHFIGEGPDHAALVRSCDEAGLHDKVTVHGRLSLDEIAIQLSGAVLLNPTILAEGFQTTLLEAVASQAAVVSTPVAAATYLKSLGAPIEIVEPRDLEGWVDKTREYLLLNVPAMDPEVLHEFDWSVRGREYNAIIGACLTTVIRA